MELHYGRVTSKGQITIPAAVRRRLGLETGAPVLFKVSDDGQIRLSSPVQDVARHFGTMPLPGVNGTDLAAMGEEIGAAEAIEHDRRATKADAVPDEQVVALVSR